MDPIRFDMLARSLTTKSSRRRLFGGVPTGLFAALSFALSGSVGLFGLADVDAKRKKKNKKKKRKKRRKPAPTCNDGIQNGSETGVDCGGDCTPCANGQGCITRADCASAFCHGSGMCQACAASSDCPDDDNGSCVCEQPAGDATTTVCLKSSSTPSGNLQTCVCRTDSLCVLVDTDTDIRRCHNRCGGGCGDALAFCESDAQCCDLSCMPLPITLEHVCLSPPGGSCRQDGDCSSCHIIDCAMGSVCDTTAGVCRCPDGFECCSKSDCGPAERCQTDPSGLYGVCVPLDVER